MMKRAIARILPATLVIALSLFTATLAEDVDSVQIAIDQTMARARAAIDAHGATDSAMNIIQGALADLAAVPKIKDRADMIELHGRKDMGTTVLATEGDTGITLLMTKFNDGAVTPVHDHMTWGVIYMLEGKNEHVRWQAEETEEADHVDLVVKEKTLLGPGESDYWLGSSDIHTQEAVDGAAWVLVVTGKNIRGDYVNKHRHYFDPESGKVTVGKRK